MVPRNGFFLCRNCFFWFNMIKKKITLHVLWHSVMLSLTFLPHPGFVSFQVENVTLYLANSQENVLWIQTVKTPHSQWNLCGSPKCRKARPSVLGEKITSWLLFPHNLSPQDIECKLQKKRQISCKSILCTTENVIVHPLPHLYHLEIPLPSGNTNFSSDKKNTRN